MTKAERQASFFHAENHLRACSGVCNHSQPSSLMALNMVIQLANDEFKDMEAYRKKLSDPMA